MSITAANCTICLEPIYSAREKQSLDIQALDLAQKVGTKKERILSHLGVDTPAAFENLHTYHFTQAGNHQLPHVGHIQCAAGWLGQKSECPECRAPVKALRPAPKPERASNAQAIYDEIDSTFSKMMTTFMLLLASLTIVVTLSAGPDDCHDY